MTRKTKEEPTAAELPVKTPKPKPAKKRARAKATPKESGAKGFDFVGKVESIVVKNGGEAGSFEFGLRGRHGARQTFRLRTSDSFSLAIIAPIVTAAHANEAKIGVRVAQVEDSGIYVVEVASRPKLGKTA